MKNENKFLILTEKELTDQEKNAMQKMNKIELARQVKYSDRINDLNAFGFALELYRSKFNRGAL